MAALLFELVIVAIVLIFWYIRRIKNLHKDYPPGPVTFPIVGNFPQMMMQPSHPAHGLDALSRTYGDIMFVQMGGMDSVVLGSHQTIMEIFNHEKASQRAPHMIPVVEDRIKGKNIGIIWSNGETWQTMRRFTIRTLRDFGFGKTKSMEAVITEELEKFFGHLDNQIKESRNGILKVDSFFDLTVINVLWRLVTGINYDMSDPRIRHLLQMSHDMVQSTTFSFDLSIGFPILRKWFPEMFNRSTQLKIRDDLYDFVQHTIDEHRSSGAYATDPQCFVDVFLAKIAESSDDPQSDYTDENLLMVLLDLFQAGADTSSNNLSFGILFVLLNQNVQQKMQDEMDAVVPKGAPITMAMKPSLPFSNATLLETLRFATVVPFPPMREASEDFYFKGYLIRKGTALMPNTYSAHFDEKVWGDPHTFRPERFLTPEGTLDGKMANLVIPFGGGKRVCLGMNLAETTLFLYFTSTIRRYKFLKVPGTSDPSLVHVVGMTDSPQPFNVLLKRRI